MRAGSNGPIMPPARKKVRSAGRPVGGAAVSRERIVARALDLIDEVGLDGFSVRHVAARLGVSPASVHWHINSKNELLAEVAGLVMEGVTPPKGKRSWQEWIAELFRRCRRSLRKHPNVAALIGAQLVSNASLRTELIEGVLVALEEAGLDGENLLEGYNCVIAAMLGFVTMEFAPLPMENALMWADALRERVNSVRPLDHPALARSLRSLANRAFILRWENGSTRPMDRSFERHVHVFIAGLEAFSQACRRT